MHTANQPYNVLSGAGLQKNSRSPDDLARLNRYAPVLRAYCSAGDPVCANGGNVAEHLNYFELYTDEASSWVVSKIAGIAPLCVAPTPSSSSSAAGVATSAGVASSSAVAAASSSVPVEGAPSAASSQIATPTPATPTAVYPTSVVTPSAFPEPQPYEPECVANIKVEYVYV
jgi:hypothetical protein